MSDQPIRYGSPFAPKGATQDTTAEEVASAGELSATGSPFGLSTQPATVDHGSSLEGPIYSADQSILVGALAAAAVVGFFSLACVAWFPAGGTLVSGLGCALSVIGLFSRRHIWGSLFLLVHLGAFAACYYQLLLT